MSGRDGGGGFGGNHYYGGGGYYRSGGGGFFHGLGLGMLTGGMLGGGFGGGYGYAPPYYYGGAGYAPYYGGYGAGGFGGGTYIGGGGFSVFPFFSPGIMLLPMMLFLFMMMLIAVKVRRSVRYVVEGARCIQRDKNNKQHSETSPVYPIESELTERRQIIEDSYTDDAINMRTDLL